MMQIKERKEMDDHFKKAQKPWAKLLTKVEKAKLDYHAACKTEKSAQNQERNANSDSSLSPDQLKKMQDRVQKTKDEVQKCRERYEQSLAEINKYNSTYIEDMTSVFTKCQETEEIRLRFFKDVLFNIHKVLNLSDNPGWVLCNKKPHCDPNPPWKSPPERLSSRGFSGSEPITLAADIIKINDAKFSYQS